MSDTGTFRAISDASLIAELTRRFSLTTAKEALYHCSTCESDWKQSMLPRSPSGEFKCPRCGCVGVVPL